MVISACPSLPGVAVTTSGFPGSLAERGTRSQLLPPSLVCSRMAGFPTMKPSAPLKLMELNLHRQQGWWSGRHQDHICMAGSTESAAWVNKQQTSSNQQVLLVGPGDRHDEGSCPGSQT